jgi:predicted N-acetyltransferase YhbS
VSAVNFAIRCEYHVAAEAFMAVELRLGYLRDASGTVKYLAAFDNL